MYKVQSQVMCLVLFMFLNLSSIGTADELNLASAAEMVVTRTNAFRNEHMQSPIEVDKTLQSTAQKFADYMAKTGKYGHHADGRTPAERATASGYDYCAVRENIAYRMDTRELTAEFLAEHFLQGWIDSSEHRENMLADYVTETAVAMASKDGTTFYAVQLFGRSKDMSYSVTLTNTSDSAWNVNIDSNTGNEEIEIPARGKLRMKRCFPITLSIVDTDATIKLGESSEVEIRATTDGPLFQSI